MIHHHLFCTAIFSLLMACSGNTNKTTSTSQDKPITSDTTTSRNVNQVDYLIINVANNQFGYYIMVDGNIFIHQATIPAIEGNEGFHTKEDAEKVAKLVTEKVRSGEELPTVSREELISLGIIPNP